MQAVDTNVLVRLIARDDAGQVESAERFLAHGAWVSVLALAETIWVLDRTYRLNTADLADTVEEFLNHAGLVLQDPDVVAAALQLFRAKPSLGFSDCLMLEIARKAGHVPLGTFDRTLGKVDGARKL